MKKELFCSIIEDIRLQIQFDQDFAYSLQKMFQTESVSLYDHSRLIKSIMKLLRLHFPPDSDGFCAIEHYCIICNFKGDNGEPKSAEELYEELTQNK